MKNIKTAYVDLFTSANFEAGYRLNNAKVYFDQLSHFVGMQGKKYAQQQTKLLIVGRAVNGWGQLDTSSTENFACDAVKKMQSSQFDWVVCDNGSLRNDCLENGKFYWLNDSPFWRTNKRIWMGLTNNCNFEDTEQNRWVDYIAWTNLYKFAPLNTGNPTATMSKKQLAACKEILQAEIQEFKPTHILFVTGYKWWFENFKEIFDIEFRDIRSNIPRGENKNSFFVEASGTTAEGIKIIVSCRPEFRDEKLYVDDVIDSFAKL